MEKIWTKKRLFKYWLPVVLWSSVIFMFSSLPTNRTSQIYWQDFIVKKTAHIVEYAIFTLLLYRALMESGIEKKKAGIYSIFLAILYGASDEFHQSFTPGREPTVRDVIFDTIGAVSIIYYIWNLLPKAPERLRTWARKWQLM